MEALRASLLCWDRGRLPAWLAWGQFSRPLSWHFQGHDTLHSVNPGLTHSSPACCSIHQEPCDEDAERRGRYSAHFRDEDKCGKERRVACCGHMHITETKCLFDVLMTMSVSKLMPLGNVLASRKPSVCLTC